jgi:hypothetical protein
MASEGFNTDSVIPLRRGRRDPALAEALGLEPTQQEQPTDVPQGETPLLYDGNTVTAKATVEIKLGDSDTWFTYEATTQLFPGEDESEANERIQLVVNTRVLELADDMEERLRQRSAARRRAPIVPR